MIPEKNADIGEVLGYIISFIVPERKMSCREHSLCDPSLVGLNDKYQ